MNKTNDEYYLKITRADWEHFIDHSCHRYEVSKDASLDYALGYRKGVQVALMDLLEYTNVSFYNYRDDVEKLEHRLLLEFGVISDDPIENE